jgi:hypothetical protein
VELPVSFRVRIVGGKLLRCVIFSLVLGFEFADPRLGLVVEGVATSTGFSSV